MFIKQYEIALPADYDMQIIRDRVANTGSNFDAFPGLGLKCFLIRERGRHGAQGNQYAPVYLWPEIERMWGFLAGPPFAKIKADFGPPPVSTWPGFAFARSPELEPRCIASVTRSEMFLPSTVDLSTLRERERGDAGAAVADDATHLARAVGLDPRRWVLVRFDFWSRPQGSHADDIHSYEVLHTSAPCLSALPT